MKQNSYQYIFKDLKRFDAEISHRRVDSVAEPLSGSWRSTCSWIMHLWCCTTPKIIDGGC